MAAKSATKQLQRVYIYHDGENLALGKDIDVHALETALLREATSKRGNGGKPFARWNIFYGSAQMPPESVKHDLNAVNAHILDAGPKANAVDTRIKAEIADFLREHLGEKHDIIVVIASGDADFANEV
jgi:hypothetical protein